MHHHLTVAIAIVLLGPCSSFAVDNQVEVDPIANQKQSAGEVAQIQQLARQLGSSQFAKRERAATALMQIGTPAMTELMRLERTTDDPEVRDRISSLVQQIYETNTQSKIDRFMAGEQVGFNGWNRFRGIMGDTVTVRELFVQVHLEHPSLLASLDGNVADIQTAMVMVNAKVQHRIFVTREHPSKADTIALLLPAYHPKVSFQPGYETTVIGVLDRLAAQQIQRDVRLETGFRSLLGSWISRCTLTNRIESLVKAMQWGVPESLPVAISTLSETDDMETLVVAMQTIARFGSKKDAVALKDLLSDDRVTGQAGYGRQMLVQTQVRDVAIATIAILHDVPLADVGFPQATTHATSGFTILGIGFSEKQNALREKSLRQVEAMLSPKPTGGS